VLPTFTTSQIARWSRVPGLQKHIDHMLICPTCKIHTVNRIRLDAANKEVERSVCDHFVEYQFKPKEGVVYFTFSISY